MNRMYGIKTLNQSADSKLLNQTTWLVEKTVRFRELTITPNAVLIAPEGYFVAMTVNGVGYDLTPGTYYGDVILHVAKVYHMEPHSLMRMSGISRDFAVAAVVGHDGADVRVPALLQGGTISDQQMENVYFATTAESFNGIVCCDDASYEVINCTFEVEGFADNDFLGVGAGVTAIDHASVKITDSSFRYSGVTRCAIHVGGRSNVIVDHCEISNISPDSDWVGSFSWQIALLGTARLCQLADGASVTYNDCSLITNGWGICSIDGTDAPVTLDINRCRLVLAGPRSHGYGAFCIGENTVTIRNSDLEVNGYPMLVQGKGRGGRPSILSSKIRGRRFGAMVYHDANSVFEIADSEFRTGSSALCVKGSATTINIRNTQFHPKNKTVLQLMDNDECGMTAQNFIIPVGEIDCPIAGRNLTVATAEDDVILNLSDMHIEGNFFNSTTNLRANERSVIGGRGTFHDTMAGLPDFSSMKLPGGMPARPKEKDLYGPKNLGLNLVNTVVKGIISAATQHYRIGLREITADNRLELGNITQESAPVVNNGVIVSLDPTSVWIVTGTSYLSSLTLAEGAQVFPEQGKRLSITVDGTPVVLQPGTICGSICISLDI